VDRCALFVDAGYVLGDGAMAVHGTRNRDSVSWDYAGVVQVLGNVARDRTGLPLLRCYWYEATVEGRRTADHETLADLPGVKLRVGRMRPGRREGVESEIHRDLTTLARNRAISDALVVSAEEDLAQVVSDVQDLGIRVILVHIPVRGAWTVAPTLRQECDDVVEISEAQLRPAVELVVGAEPAGEDERQAAGAYAARAPANGHGPTGALGHRQALPVGSHAAPPAIYTGPVIAEYQRAAQPAISQSAPTVNSSGPLGGAASPAGSPGPSVSGGGPGPVAPPGPQAAIASPPGTARPGAVSQPATPSSPGIAPSAPAPPGVAPGMPGQHAAPTQPAAGVPGGPGMPQGMPGQPAHAGQPGVPQPAPGLPQRGQPGPRPAGHGAHAAPQPQPAAPGLTQPYQATAGQPGGVGQQGQLPPGVSQPGMTQPGLPGYQAAPPAPTGFRGQGPEAVPGQAPAGSRLPPASAPPGQLPPGPAAPPAASSPVQPGQPLRGGPQPSFQPGTPTRPAGGPHEQRAAQQYPAVPAGQPDGGAPGTYIPQQGPHSGPQPAAQPAPVPAPVAVSLADAVQAAHGEGFNFGQAVARDAPALWLEAVLARKPRMPSDLEARLLQDSSLPIDSLLHDEVRHALRRGFWDALERVRH
jgi:uncharacterized LabA/DUF88 family protein